MKTTTVLFRLPIIGMLLLILLGFYFNAAAKPQPMIGDHTIYMPLIVQRPALVFNEILSGIDSPSSLRFAPDGRLFISERITGKLRLAHKNPNSGTYSLQAQPYYTFNTPRNSAGTPQPYASGGLRDIVFDPNFSSNGYIYAFYMSDNSLQNRIVRIKRSSSNNNLADPNSETVIFEVPFNNTQATGSHNGGAMQFGTDGKLYFTTGDGLDNSDPVQSINTFTGKLFRINTDGSIPSDNPFYNQTSGSYRAIYALGLRNPFSMSMHPQTSALYINDVTDGGGKAVVYRVEPGANYKHLGPDDTAVANVGTKTNPWARPSNAGSKVLTGGVWISPNGPFSAQYAGAYITALWGDNNDLNGQFNYIVSNSDNTAVPFATGIGVLDSANLALKPTQLRRGPDGLLYYLLSTYQTKNGQVWTIIP